MRLVIAVIIAAVAAAAGLMAYHVATSSSTVVLPAPRQIVAISDVASPVAGQVPSPGVESGQWSSSPTVTIGVTPPARLTTGLDVEVRPRGVQFTGAPTLYTKAPGTGPACPSGVDCFRNARRLTVRLHLSDGRYHWQVRFHSADGLSPWVQSRKNINVDSTPPLTPVASSITDPNPSATYHSSNITFSWHSTDLESGIAGYSYLLDTHPTGAGHPGHATVSPTISLTGIATGAYFFHVQAVDRAGNWSPAATFPVRIDVTPPGLAHVRFSMYDFDPKFDKLRISFATTKPAARIRVGIYKQTNGQLFRMIHVVPAVAGKVTIVTWDGKDASGQFAPSGQYEVYVRVFDQYGHSSLTGWRDFGLDYRRIVVSLNQQKLWAYDGDRLFVTSLVTTGNRALPTPVGLFHIIAKFHPFTFKSPWPKSSQFYYPPSKTEWAMLFQADGYFIHVAPWRSAFGPGTNAGVGTPGSNFTGTHGCINVPSDIAQELYAWALPGTVVQVTS